MKWINKRHEFDEVASIIPEAFHKKIYVFGAGEYGKIMGVCLEAFGLLGGYIDNDVKRQGTEYLNKAIVSLENYLNEEKNIAIVIAMSVQNSRDVVNQLKEKGLKETKDFYLFDEFYETILPIITTYYFNKSFMKLAQITLTERCSLKCKKCAHACYNVDHTAEDMPLFEVYSSADSFFTKVDFIYEFVLIGGEPLLYNNISKAITYIGERYRGQMARYSITTNGTIVPTEDVLEACRKYQVSFRISNYSKAVPRLRESHKKLMNALDKYGIDYVLAPEDGNWIDYGFEYLNKEFDEKKLIESFDSCLTPCREVRGNKLYFCVMARSVSDNLHFNEGKEDYLNLDELEGKDYKRELLEFNFGYSEKGYLDMCRRCYGMNGTKHLIPVAEQLI